MRGPLVRGVGGVLRSMLTRSSDKTAFLLEWRNSQHRPKQHPDRGLLPRRDVSRVSPLEAPAGRTFGCSNLHFAPGGLDIDRQRAVQAGKRVRACQPVQTLAGRAVPKW